MTGDPSFDVSPWLDPLRRILSETPWLLATNHLVGGTRRAKELLDWGAPAVFVAASSPGTGEVTAGIPHLVLDVRSSGMLDGIRRSERALNELAPEHIATIDAWDPGRRARVWRPFYSTGHPLAGRATFGRRPDAWQALEDKTVIDAVWDAAGVERAPSQVVPVRDAETRRAWASLDQGDGVVFCGDNREGFNGGASLVRWGAILDCRGGCRVTRRLWA